MDNLLKKFRFLNSRYFYYSIVLIIVLSLAIYPPNIGVAIPQRVWSKPIPKAFSKVDSLKIAIFKTDSLINKQCTLLLKQQDTIKRLIKKQ